MPASDGKAAKSKMRHLNTLRLSTFTVLAIFLVLVTAAAGPAQSARKVAATLDRPNIILFLTDDQDLSSLKYMPFTSSFEGWTKFTHGYVNYSLCCPSRATILSGQYSHHTGVETNEESANFDDTHTLGTWMQGAGYDTALIGKYFNDYPWDRGSDYIPPGWDEWQAFNSRTRYYNYTINSNGTTESYGSEPQAYSTTVLGDKALQWIAPQAPGKRERPFFLYFAPYGPHQPRTPAPGDEEVYGPEDVDLPPNYNERNISDKPQWVKHLSGAHLYRGQRLAKTQLAMSYNALLSEDRLLQAMFAQLDAQGELQNTIIIFMSDNGFSYGSHRWKGKTCMYDECNHVPYLVYDPLNNPEGGKSGALVSNVDLAETITGYGGTEPNNVQDGQSLIPIIRQKTDKLAHKGVLFRTNANDGVAEGWGLRTNRWVFLSNKQGKGRFQELYDAQGDPNQMRNLLYRGQRQGVGARARYRRYRRVADQMLRRLRDERGDLGPSADAVATGG
jgi:N-acetylglucosamine-6-sulfatase